MPPRPIPTWITIEGASPNCEAVCTRCGERRRVPLPMPITDFLLWSRGFGMLHEGCELVACVGPRLFDDALRARLAVYPWRIEKV